MKVFYLQQRGFPISSVTLIRSSAQYRILRGPGRNSWNMHHALSLGYEGRCAQANNAPLANPLIYCSRSSLFVLAASGIKCARAL
jgi:hypothetical protein